MAARLPGARYKKVFDGGRVVRGRLVTAWSFKDDGAAGQAGVVVSKKSFHDAVKRNRAKRLVREAFRLLAKEGAFPAKTDWIFVGRHALDGKKCADVMAELKWMAGKAAMADAAPKHEARGA